MPSETKTTIVSAAIGIIIILIGVLLMVFAVSGKGVAKGLKPVNRAKLGCSAAMTILIGFWFLTRIFTG